MARFQLKLPLEVDAEKATHLASIMTRHGTVHVLPGDWIVNGEFIFNDRSFKDFFEPLDPEADELMDGDI